jgi:hypothetical protein
MPYKVTNKNYHIYYWTTRINHFALLNVGGFGPCREVFASNWINGDEYILFSHPPKKGKLICDRINKLEKKLNIKFRLTDFGPTQYNNISWIKVSYFWRKSYIKRSLFTALLRGCSRAKNSKYHTIIKNEYVLKDTRKAVDIFFNGNTRLNSKTRTKSGWRNIFNGNHNLKLLIKPKC